MKFEEEGIHLFDVPSLIPLNINKINKNLKYLAFVFNFNLKREEKKIYEEAQERGYTCFIIENLNSAEICANFVYNLNQIGEIVLIHTNNFLLFQLVGPRSFVYYEKKKKF